MIWQFGEVGYDVSIDDPCRVCNKPIRWDYYQVWSALIRLKRSQPAFCSRDFALDVGSAAKRIAINHKDMDVRIIGNFDVEALSIDPDFSRTGTWYDFFGLDSLQVSGLNDPVMLQAGEYRIYTTKRLFYPEITAGVPPYQQNEPNFLVYPNPSTGLLHMDAVQEESVIRIFDIQGREVQTIGMPLGHNILDLSHLENGWYVISRTVKGQAPQHARFVLCGE